MDTFNPYSGKDLLRGFPHIADNLLKLIYIYVSRGGNMRRILRKAKPSTLRLFTQIRKHNPLDEKNHDGYLSLELLAQTFPVQVLRRVLNGKHRMFRPFPMEKMQAICTDFPLILMFPQVASVIPRVKTNIINVEGTEKVLRAISLYLLQIRNQVLENEDMWDSASNSLLLARQYHHYSYVDDAQREKLCFHKGFSEVYIQDAENRKLRPTEIVERAAHLFDWYLVYAPRGQHSPR